MSEARKMILQMLAEGKITVEESERLLTAIKDENSSSKTDSEEPKARAYVKDSFDPFTNATGLGFDLRNIAQNIQQTLQQTMKKTEPRSREFKDKMKEFGSWMQDMVNTMANEMAQTRGEPADAVSVDFAVPAVEAIDQCTSFNIENVFGEIRIHKGTEFKMHVTGRVAKSSLGEYQALQWFNKYGVRIKDQTFNIAFDKNQGTSAILDMEITLPPEVEISCRTVSSDIRIRGNFNVNELKTVSGNIRVMGATLKDSQIETVSGDVQVEGGEIAMQIKSTSGDFIVRESIIKELRINSVSGDILLAEATVDESSAVKLVTTSGDIIVEKISGPWNLVETITRSGDVILDWRGDATPLNPQGTQLKSGAEGAIFTAESVSGDIQFL